MEPRAGVSKQDIREQIWDYMESQNLADFPRPVHHRIPNFKGSYLACQNIRDLEVFARTQELKVDPDKPLEGVRLLALQGVRNYSVPVGLDSKVLVDLVVVGSVAVSEKGWRIGKGEGYADLEYAMMVSMGAVSQGTPVVTIVHDCQVVDIPEALLEDHDLTVDYILTPTRVITTGCERPKPAGIAWSKISCEMLGKMPILRSLRHREEQAGKDVTLRDGPRSPPGATRSPRDLAPPELGSVPLSSVQIGNLPPDARVSELKQALSALGVAPSRLTWQGPQHRAFLHYRDPAEAQQAIACLQGFRLGANTVRVVLARQQRASDLVGSHTTEPLPDHQPAIAGP
ncbi:methenyltetrahydrofolate synthase domain-containing protein isoform X7 [Bubalus kerabau]|uniref:methenyltetrahydrofolate synthase domain-containing protein isoform X7 n=1 Tax=Bubalus carabanensis TaxID=3119969 RepID=UPI00244E99E4|nr:methenyltetrahydrofolate synthase domain-containing protein isoform X7 [Bubalus carabanensis]